MRGSYVPVVSRSARADRQHVSSLGHPRRRPLPGIPDVPALWIAGPRGAGVGPRHAQPHHPEEFATSAARRRPVCARHHVLSWRVLPRWCRPGGQPVAGHRHRRGRRPVPAARALGIGIYSASGLCRDRAVRPDDRRQARRAALRRRDQRRRRLVARKAEGVRGRSRGSDSRGDRVGCHLLGGAGCPRR